MKLQDLPKIKTYSTIDKICLLLMPFQLHKKTTIKLTNMNKIRKRK
jgi:hypothetical protein